MVGDQGVGSSMRPKVACKLNEPLAEVPQRSQKVRGREKVVVRASRGL